MSRVIVSIEPQRWMTAVEGTVATLKKRFPNLTVEETLKLAHEITLAVIEAVQKEKE